MENSRRNYPTYKKIGFFAGPLLFLIIFFLPTTLAPLTQSVIAVATWMVSWWITETVSLSVTALLPLLLFPMIGVMEMKEVAQPYGSPIIFLFFGGFVLALAMEKVNLHKRIALTIVKWTGTSANRVVLGFMLAAALLSMWISNTASTVVMLPIALSVIQLLINDEDGYTPNDQNFALSIMLGIAFAANIGGTATVIGTPPNSVLVGFLENEYQMEISFLKWMIMGIPFAALLLSIAYFLLVKILYPNHLGQLKASSTIIDQELKKLGTISAKEKRVLFIFLTVASLWILRTTINFYFPSLKLTDAGISMLGAISLFALPFDFQKGEFILDWKDTSRLPWGILILFGGGLALASGLSKAGIVNSIGAMIAEGGSFPIFWITALLILVMLFMTELMSNVALVAIFVPVVAGIALGLEVPILHLAIPITLAASCAFMLPMATPPNAIVFASGHIKVYQMVKVGVILNLISVLLLIVLGNTVVKWLF